MRGRVTKEQSDEDGGKPEAPGRQRSTRRRQDTPDLPRRKMTARTIGRTFTGTGGRIYRPSTFLTLTLDSIRLKTSVRFVRRLVAERRIPFTKVGKYVRFYQSDVEAFIASGRVDSLAESRLWREIRRLSA